jgi:hypothetical protein
MFSNFKAGEGRVKCSLYGKWAHAACTGVEEDRNTPVTNVKIFQVYFAAKYGPLFYPTWWVKQGACTFL